MAKYSTVVVSRIALVVALLMATLALAVGTPAGEEIRNQATAHYIDSSGDPQTTNSNQVITVVKQIFGVSVVADGTTAAPGQSQDATPGSTVYFPYTLTNTGNGVDSFTLTSDIDTDGTTDNGGISSPVYYLDSNGDGVVQPGEALITSVRDLPADESVKLIMAYQIPTGADTGDTVIASPIGTSVNDPAATPATDTDNYHQTTVVQDAVIVSSKSVNVSQADPGDTLQFTITATNTGSQNAENVTITDAAPAGTTFVAASTVPAANGTSITLSTAAGVEAVFATVVPGQVVELTFSVTVDASTPPGDILNTAVTSYEKSSDPPGTPPTVVTTNTTTTEIQPSYSVAVGPKDDPTDDDGVDADYTTSEGYTVSTVDGDDEQTVASASAGDTVSFINSVVNNGTGTDTLNISTAPSLPAGASVLLTRLDGTPLSDTDGDGQPDSGPLAPGEEFDFIVQVVLPQGFDDQDGATTVHSVVVTATSGNDATQIDTTTNTIEDIVGPGVSFGNSDGVAGSVDPTPVDKAVDPGTPAVYPMDVLNTGSGDDSFDLSGTTTLTTPDGSVTVPVVYYPASADTDADGTLSPAEIASATPITNTGTLAPDTEAQVFAVVNVPDNADPQTQTIDQSVTSPLSGASASFDVDTVTVNDVKTFSFSPDRNGTAPSPGTVIYQHELSNTGNVAITDITLTETPSGNQTGWTYLYSYDAVTYFPAASLPAPSTPIAPGGSQPLFVKINVPAGVPQGAANVLDITAEPTFGTDAAPTGSANVTDTTIVVGGEITVLKEWSLDGTNWYKGDGTDIGTVPEVAPGEDIQYRMTITNIGTADVTAIEVYDSVPTFTDFVQGSQDAGTGNTALCSTDGGVSYAACPTGSGIDTSVSTLEFTIASMVPGASVEVSFTVRVQ